jgi:two-component system, cell cycle sensor histidine kinase and response regulator CckA
MKRTLRVLNIEDSERDVTLLRRHLSRAGYDLISERVETPAAMKAALEAREWDCILCDYSMPNFSALQALALLEETELDIPFIIISGTIGEAVAVEAMRAGADDYLMKDNLVRLVPAIEREMHDAKNRRARLQAEGQLRVTQQRLEQALASSPSVIYRLQIQGTAYTPLWISENISGILGYTVEEALDPDWWSRQVHPDDLAGMAEDHNQLLSNGRLVRNYRFRQKDGSYRWVRDEQRLLGDPQGRPSEIVGAWVDITNSKQAAESLSEANQTLQSLVQTSPLAIIAYDLEGNVRNWNAAAERIFGWSEAELIGRRNPIIPEDRWVEFSDALEITRQGGTFTNFETTRTAKDGSLIDVSLSSAPLVDGKGNINGSVSVIADITERRQLEEQLRHSQKMEAVGRLAGGIAHDFNNLLTAIIGYSQLAIGRLRKEDSMRKELEEIERAGQRAAALTSQLLAFSRRQVLQPEVLDLNSVVSDLAKMLHRLIGEDIELDIQLDSSLGRVRADRGQVDQIIMNLVVNSRDAMPEGGKLTIETANVELDESYASEHVDARTGRYVMLAISDNGAGMDKQTRLRIFEPFFTTKEQGKGTGLGLSTVYGIVKQSGGNIGVYSEPGTGTTFKIYLPRVDDQLDYKQPGGAPSSHLEGTETILLVEDEASVRRLARIILEAKGYSVVEASGADEAHKMSEQHSGPINLMLTDVIMPGSSGRELAQGISRSRLEMKVLYMSGYTDDAIVHHGILDARTPFIQKPFTPEALLRKVRDVLDLETS